ncbi:MAG: ABC transporter permease [Acidobacteria bacterium]|nr:ABC transporter permease [Acidobacteriota bacterium]MCW5950554.1 ABC transporter permease [Pyrinomonadaceae bacterium]
MNLAETLKLALDAIRAHKLRSFLTLLGMIVAVMAFMIVVSLLIGFSKYVDEKLSKIGSNTFSVTRFNFDDFKDTDTIAAAQRRNKELTFDERDFIRQHAQLVEMIGARSPSGGMTREVKGPTGEPLRDVQLVASEPNIVDIEKRDVAEGRFFTNTENDNSMRVVYIGMDIANKLFPAGNALGSEIVIEGIPYRIIGIQTAKGTVFGRPQDNFVEFPIKTFGANFGGLKWNRAPYFVVKAKDDKSFADAVEEVRTLMRIKRKVPLGEKDTFGMITPDAISGLVNRIMGPVGIVLIVVPTIALLVGAIVIMNIMLVAVTERTREIGIRKSLGARQSDILKQFLFESAMLAALGGIIGLVLAHLAGYIITAMFLQTNIPWWAAVLAIAFSALVGIMAGLYPARMAARLDPIEALRAD